jgi:uncharacterized damage-inducible protein DinB
MAPRAKARRATKTTKATRTSARTPARSSAPKAAMKASTSKGAMKASSKEMPKAAAKAPSKSVSKHPRLEIGPKEQFLNAFSREHQTTKRVLQAYPRDKHDLRPHSKSKTAAELAWTFNAESLLAEKALTEGLDWSKPPAPSAPPPKSLDAIIEAFEAGHARVADLVEDMSDDELMETVRFPVAPKTLGDVPKIDFLWMLLSDQIHHRGQFSVYLRMAEAKVPSIYGPSADEPWM